ncbi:uncharacterized protein LJ264_009177 isoform 1-T1 [Porphyrio hochstetteri]
MRKEICLQHFKITPDVIYPWFCPSECQHSRILLGLLNHPVVTQLLMRHCRCFILLQTHHQSGLAAANSKLGATPSVVPHLLTTQEIHLHLEPMCSEDPGKRAKAK